MTKMPHYTTFDGCAYGLKSSDGKPMKKTWKVASTHERIKGLFGDCIQQVDLFGVNVAFRPPKEKLHDLDQYGIAILSFNDIFCLGISCV
jgi:hypothetical protein